MITSKFSIGDEVLTPYDLEKPKQGTVVFISPCERFVRVKKKIGSHVSATRINEYHYTLIKHRERGVK